MLIRLRCHNISYLNANVDDAVIIIFFLECKNEPLLFCSIAKNRHWPGPQGSRRPTAHHYPARARTIQTASVQTDIVSWNPGDTAAAVVTSEQVPPVRAGVTERLAVHFGIWGACSASSVRSKPRRPWNVCSAWGQQGPQGPRSSEDGLGAGVAQVWVSRWNAPGGPEHS